MRNLLLKQQLIVLRRARKRAQNLTSSDRLLCGFWSIFLSPGRIRKAALALRPSTLLAFHQAVVRQNHAIAVWVQVNVVRSLENGSFGRNDEWLSAT